MYVKSLGESLKKLGRKKLENVEQGTIDGDFEVFGTYYLSYFLDFYLLKEMVIFAPERLHFFSQNAFLRPSK